MMSSFLLIFLVHQIFLFTFSKVFKKRCRFAQNSPIFFAKLVKLINSSPPNFLCVGLINCCICPNVCPVVFPLKSSLLWISQGLFYSHFDFMETPCNYVSIFNNNISLEIKNLLALVSMGFSFIQFFTAPFATYLSTQFFLAGKD